MYGHLSPREADRHNELPTHRESYVGHLIPDPPDHCHPRHYDDAVHLRTCVNIPRAAADMTEGDSTPVITQIKAFRADHVTISSRHELLDLRP